MITIRKAEPTDATVIAEFQVKMAWETESYKLDPETVTKGVDAVFKDPSKGKYYVADSDGKVIASLLITFEWSDWRNTNVWWIQSVYVLPEFRRKGVFRSMYSVIKEESTKAGIPGLRLYVELNNIRAQKTYRSLGMNSDHYALFEWFRE